MNYSLKQFSNDWQAVIDRVTTRTTWKEDLIRGAKAVLTGGASLAEQGFSEVERSKLRRQLEHIDLKLSLAYQSLGKRSMDHWSHQQNLDEKEKHKSIQKIEDILKEREKLTSEIEILSAPSLSPSDPTQSVSE